MAGEKDSARAQRFKTLRNRERLSQRALGELAGVSLRAVQQWEAGDPISWPNAVQAARVLKTTPLYLIRGDTEGEDAPAPEDDLRSRVARLEGSVAQDGAERRSSDALRGGFRQVAELIGDLRAQTEAEVSGLREELRATQQSVVDLMHEVGRLRAEVLGEVRLVRDALPTSGPISGRSPKRKPSAS